MAKETGSIRNITDKEFDFVLGVNLKGTLNALRAELPHMQSVLYNSLYVASKHAIAGITRTLALEEGKRAIRENAVAPGIIDTPLLTALQSTQDSDAVSKLFGDGLPGALGLLGDSKEVGELIAFLLSPLSSFINGVVVLLKEE
ncbi:hypothetical protein DL771_010479 [Monosporascus sp. 5C6A]|nr:hypothetical protein DL771_010479 [Monosporascus sp. 5C6A]